MMNVQFPPASSLDEKSVGEREESSLTMTELAMLVHDLRTPIISMLGFNAIAETEEDSATRTQAHLRIDALGHHLLSLVNDILLTARSEQEGIVLDHVVVSAPRLLGDVMAVVQPAATSKQVKLKLTMNYDLPLEFMGDPLRLRQVLINLLSNAVHFSPSGGTVALEAGLGLPKAVLSFSIQDQGPGMTEAEAAALFRPFHQIKRISGAHGTGLGLAICDRLVRRMGGSIQLKSIVGEGTRFTIAIPYCSRVPDNAATAVASTEDAPAPSRSFDILVVDDNELANEIITHVARKAGHNVSSVTNGLSALDFLAKKTVDLVLLDQRMEGMDGLETARRIRAMTSVAANTKIIALTAHLTPDLAERAKSAGMDGCFQRTTRPKELIALIESVLKTS